MTTPAELSRLIEVAEGFGTVPMLLTVDDGGRPRAVAVSPAWQDPDGQDGAPVTARTVTLRVGHRSFANAQARPDVALVWPAPPGGRFALLADATVRGAEPEEQPAPGGPGHATHKPGGTLTLTVEFAILHQVAAR